ncbi:MAG TPA: 3-dehydroquinate synthase, partial [Casimicrobiaceae bacterium]|nr:3-dehydroquinate synthase [Casimicrobiaceae bacterium]
ALIQRAGLPVRGPALDAERYLSLMARDKKVEAGRLRFILLESLGRGVLRGDVSKQDVIGVLAEERL